MLETDLLSETLYLLWLHNELINTELVKAFKNEFSKKEIDDVFTKIHSMGFGIPSMIEGDKHNYYKLHLSYKNDKTEIVDERYNYTKTDLKIWQKILELNFLHVNRCPKPILAKLDFKDGLKRVVDIGVLEGLNMSESDFLRMTDNEAKVFAKMAGFGDGKLSSSGYSLSHFYSCGIPDKEVKPTLQNMIDKGYIRYETSLNSGNNVSVQLLIPGIEAWRIMLADDISLIRGCPKEWVDKLGYTNIKNINAASGVFEKNMKDFFNEIEIDKVEFDYTDYSESLNESAEDDFNPDFVPELSGELINKDKIEQFMFAGKAIFTIRNNETGNRFTFRVMRPKKVKDDVYFVSVLTGGDNNSMYSFFGTIFDKSDAKKCRFKVAAKNAKISLDSQSIKVFIWFFNTLMSPKPFPSQVQIWHEGVCGKCGKKLTVPESIDIGLGPICARSAELWQRSKRLVDTNNASGVFDSFKHLKSLKLFETEKKEKMDRLLDNWEDAYKLNKKVLTALRKVKSKDGYGDEFSKNPFEDKIKEVLSKFEPIDLKIKGIGTGYEVSFKIDSNKFKFEFFTNGKIKDDKVEEKINELTSYDDIFLGKKLKEVKDLIASFRIEPSYTLNDKPIVAMDQFNSVDEAIEQLKQNGYSIGRMQGSAPIGIAKGNFDIQKWRNIGADADKLDGIIVECENDVCAIYFTFPEI